MNPRTAPLLALVAALGLAVAQGSRADEAPIGSTIAVKGEARAEGPSGTRGLACGSPVYAGDRIVTGKDSLAGILTDSGYVQVLGESSLDFARGPEGEPRADLVAGQARAVGEGEKLVLAARGADAKLGLNDTEAYVLDEKVGPFAMFCDWDSPLHVTRGNESLDAGPGSCILAKPKEPLYVADVHEQRLALGSFDQCESPDVAAGPLSSRFVEPRDVAAGELLPGYPDPLLAPDFAREPCDDPGSGCAAAFAAGTSGVAIIDPQPDLDPCDAPGAQCIIDPQPDLNPCGAPGAACGN